MTGQVLASAAIPTDGGVVEYFGSVTVTGGHTYAYYLNQQRPAGRRGHPHPAERLLRLTRALAPGAGRTLPARAA